MGGGRQVSVPQVVLAPFHSPPSATQLAWVRMLHGGTFAPRRMQQAPVGGGGAHVVLVHTVLAPFQTPLSFTQLACVRTLQFAVPAGLVMQHAPVGTGAGQVVLVQTVFAPFQAPPSAAHAACVRIEQLGTAVALLMMQHAPGGFSGGQFAFAQVVFGPRHTPMVVGHWLWGPTKQPVVVPGAVMQHAPTGGGRTFEQEVVVQTEPAPSQRPPSAMQLASDLEEQVVPAGLVMQQAPVV